MFLYRRTNLIVSVTNSFKTELIARGIAADKIEVVINGVNLDRYAPLEKDQAMASEFGLEDKFVVGYIGTHGMAHALHRVLETADLLRKRKEIVFLLVGSGAPIGANKVLCFRQKSHPRWGTALEKIGVLK